MIAAHRADNRFNGMEIHVIHHTSMSRQTIPISQLLSSPTLFPTTSYHTHTQTHRHFHTSPSLSPDSTHTVVSFHCFPAIPHPRFFSFYRVASHQFETTIRSLEIRVDIPNAQTRVQRMAHSRNSKSREHFTDSLHREPIECR